MKQGLALRAIFEPERILEIREAIPAAPMEKERTMNYFLVPEGKRLTEYEQLIGYTQQSADYVGGGLEIGEYMQKHAGGRGAYANETTELKTRDWFRFRDPDRRWFYPAVKAKSEDGRAADRFLRSISAEGSVRGIDPNWLGFLEVDYATLTLFEYGLFNAHASATKDSLSDFVKMWVALTGFDKNDASQMVQMERVFLAKMIEGFEPGLERGKEVWTTSPIYAGVRTAVEKLWARTFDWAEIMWATHAIIDPICGHFMRREFYQRVAPTYGDNVTPWILSQAGSYAQTAKLGIRKLYGPCLSEDPEFGEHNRIVIQAWTDKWLPLAVSGLKDFLGIYAQLPSPNEAMAGRDAVEVSVAHIFADWMEDFGSVVDHQANIDDLTAQVMVGYPA